MKWQGVFHRLSTLTDTLPGVSLETTSCVTRWLANLCASDHLLSHLCWSVSQWCGFEATSHRVHNHDVIWHNYSMCRLGNCGCLQRLGGTWGHWPKRELGEGQCPPKQQPHEAVRGCEHKPQWNQVAHQPTDDLGKRWKSPWSGLGNQPVVTTISLITTDAKFLN